MHHAPHSSGCPAGHAVCRHRQRRCNAAFRRCALRRCDAARPRADCGATCAAAALSRQCTQRLRRDRASAASRSHSCSSPNCVHGARRRPFRALRFKCIVCRRLQRRTIRLRFIERGSSRANPASVRGSSTKHPIRSNADRCNTYGREIRRTAKDPSHSQRFSKSPDCAVL